MLIIKQLFIHYYFILAAKLLTKLLWNSGKYLISFHELVSLSIWNKISILEEKSLELLSQVTIFRVKRKNIWNEEKTNKQRKNQQQTMNPRMRWR